VDIIFPDPPSEFLIPNSVSDPPFAGWTSTLPKRSYKSLILVGHSEGGLAIRRAVVLAAKRHRQGEGAEEKISIERCPILRSELYLFAPAFLGYSPRGVLGPLAVTNLLLRFSPAFADMRDGGVLAQLKSDTEWLQEDFGYVRAAFARVLFGTGENLVARGEYRRDFPETPELRRNHSTVCKPDRNYLRPLEFISISTMTTNV